MTKDTKQDTSIAVIEEKVSKLERWIDNADANHFPSIENRFDRIEKRLAYWGGALAVVIPLIQFLLEKYAGQ